MIGVFAIAAALLLWGVFGGFAGRLGFTAPLVFIAAGLLLQIDGTPTSVGAVSTHAMEAFASITLSLLLFSDASRFNLKLSLREDVLPFRLLLIGMPLFILLVWGAAYAMIAGLSSAAAFTLAAMLAPTDAALADQVIHDRRLSARLRQTLNVEAGLNDGLSTPFVVVAASIAWPGIDVGEPVSGPLKAVLGILLSVVLGAAIGYAGAWLLARATRGDEASALGDKAFVSMALPAIAVIAYIAAEPLHANGLVTTWVAGLAAGLVAPQLGADAFNFVTKAGTVLSLVVFGLFGVLLLPDALDQATWTTLAFALVVLVARIPTVYVALIGHKVPATEAGMLAWFGPKGLASVLFALIVTNGGDPTDPMLSAVLVATYTTVFVSAVVHGISSGPATRYVARRSQASTAEPAA